MPPADRTSDRAADRTEQHTGQQIGQDRAAYRTGRQRQQAGRDSRQIVQKTTREDGKRPVYEMERSGRGQRSRNSEPNRYE